MAGWIRRLFRRRGIVRIPLTDDRDDDLAFPEDFARQVAGCRVIEDDPDPVRDEVLRRAMLTDGPVFARVDEDGTVKYSDAAG